MAKKSIIKIDYNNFSLEVKIKNSKYKQFIEIPTIVKRNRKRT